MKTKCSIACQVSHKIKTMVSNNQSLSLITLLCIRDLSYAKFMKRDITLSVAFLNTKRWQMSCHYYPKCAYTDAGIISWLLILGKEQKDIARSPLPPATSRDEELFPQ